MYAPIFEVCSSDTSIQSLLGDGPTLRLYPFGQALQDEKRPYAVWRTIYGSPENYLGTAADCDSCGLLVDVYARTATSAREVAAALFAVIELHAYITEYSGEARDPETQDYRYSFTVDWIKNR